MTGNHVTLIRVTYSYKSKNMKYIINLITDTSSFCKNQLALQNY